MPMLLLNEEEVERLLPMSEALEAVEMAFRKIGLEEAVNLTRSRAVTDHAQIHIMGATIKGMGAMGAWCHSRVPTGRHFSLAVTMSWPSL